MKVIIESKGINKEDYEVESITNIEGPFQIKTIIDRIEVGRSLKDSRGLADIPSFKFIYRIIVKYDNDKSLILVNNTFDKDLIDVIYCEHIIPSLKTSFYEKYNFFSYEAINHTWYRVELEK